MELILDEIFKNFDRSSVLLYLEELHSLDKGIYEAARFIFLKNLAIKKQDSEVLEYLKKWGIEINAIAHVFSEKHEIYKSLARSGKRKEVLSYLKSEEHEKSISCLIEIYEMAGEKEQGFQTALEGLEKFPETFISESYRLAKELSESSASSNTSYYDQLAAKLYPILDNILDRDIAFKALRL